MIEEKIVLETKPLLDEIWMPLGMFEEKEVNGTFLITGNRMTKNSETTAIFEDRVWEYADSSIPGNISGKSLKLRIQK